MSYLAYVMKKIVSDEKDLENFYKTLSKEYVYSRVYKTLCCLHVTLNAKSNFTQKEVFDICSKYDCFRCNKHTGENITVLWKFIKYYLNFREIENIPELKAFCGERHYDTTKYMPAWHTALFSFWIIDKYF